MGHGHWGGSDRAWMRHKDGTRAAEGRRQHVRQMQQNQRNETKSLRSSKTAIAANKVVQAVAAEAAVAEPTVTGEAAAAEAVTVGIMEVRVSEVAEWRSGSNESKCSGCGGRMQCKWRSKVSVDRELSSQYVMGRRRQRLARCCCVQTATNERQPTTEETATNRI